MIVGIIKTRDILLHPITIIQMRGIVGFLEIMKRAFSTKTYRFINLMTGTVMTRRL